MVEKAVTINTQKLEAQHSERIDSALRQAASDAAADKEVALSEQRAQLKEEADAKMFKQVVSRASRATAWTPCRLMHSLLLVLAGENDE